jgi:hypothetical protein
MRRFDSLNFAPLPAILPETWSRPASFSFCRQLLDVPLVDTEIFNCAHSMPVLVADSPTGLDVVGIVEPRWSTVGMIDAKGGWIPSYAPMALRTLPFRRSLDGQRTLQWLDAEALGTRVIEVPSRVADGSHSPELKTFLALADKLLNGRTQLRRKAELLLAAGLLRSLHIDDQARNDDPVSEERFLTIDQEAFDGLSPDRWRGVAGDGMSAVDLAVALQFSQRLLAPALRQGLPPLTELDTRKIKLSPRLPASFTGMVEFDVMLDGSELIVFNEFESR